MKKLLLPVALVVILCFGAAAPQRVAVTVDPATGVLKYPTNFFAANASASASAVTGNFQPATPNGTNWASVSTNFAALVATALANAMIVNNGMSNVIFNSTNLVTTLVATNDAAISNLTINFDAPRREVFATNDITLTNFAGLLAGTAKSIRIHIIPQGVNRAVTFPTLGAPSFGTYFHTNQTFPIWGTLTNGFEYMLYLTTRGTNVYCAITHWM